MRRWHCIQLNLGARVLGALEARLAPQSASRPLGGEYQLSSRALRFRTLTRNYLSTSMEPQRHLSNWECTSKSSIARHVRVETLEPESTRKIYRLVWSVKNEGLRTDDRQARTPRRHSNRGQSSSQPTDVTRKARVRFGSNRYGMNDSVTSYSRGGTS